MKRRHFLTATALAAGAVVAASRPGDNGAPYSDYFSNLNRQMRQLGDGRPRLLLDLDLLDRNIARLMSIKNPQARYRLVEKSLPCPELIAHILDQTGSSSLMSFHLPFLQQDTRRFANADILVGKPLPQIAAARFYQEGIYSGFVAHQQLTWLIDSKPRLQQYLEVARAHRTKIRFCVEIDVGLHRGGLTDASQLDALMALVDANEQNLEFAGFMGYDAHIGKIPAIVESRDASFNKALDRYRHFVGYVKEKYPGKINERTILNGAGSPTFALHKTSSACNDLSAGSCLVKPSDFDVATLEGFTPAAFIATPVLKKLPESHLPGMESFTPLTTAWNPNRRIAYFIYGGHWLAKPYAPAGLLENPLYGLSTNQQLLNGSSSTDLVVDDHVFWRPSQSESVFLQFGDIWAIRNGSLVARWPVLQEEA